MNIPVDGADVLRLLIPNGGWSIIGDDFNSIKYDKDIKPITKKQFDDGYGLAEKSKQAETEAKATAKASAQAKLEALGLTVKDLQALGL
jgi:hypothetical protein